MKQEEEKLTGLPENAFRALKPGEVYNPLMSPDKKYPEVNLWSVLWGIAMAILFSAAAAYLGLKVGQVFEAAIPIAIIAVGVSGAAKRKNALGENVIIQSIGASSGVIVAVASGKGYWPCMSLTKYLRNGMRKRIPSTPPSNELMNTCVNVTVISSG